MEEMRPQGQDGAPTLDDGVGVNGTGENGAGNGRAAHRYAGFWLRLVAVVIDGLVLWAVSVLTFDLIRRAQGIGPTDLSWVDIIEIAFGLAYYVVLTVMFGQTLGKMVVGIRVIPRQGGENRWGSILLRESIGKLVSTLLLMIGFLMAAFDREKRALHDRMAGTVVIKVR